MTQKIKSHAGFIYKILIRKEKYNCVPGGTGPMLSYPSCHSIPSRILGQRSPHPTLETGNRLRKLSNSSKGTWLVNGGAGIPGRTSASLVCVMAPHLPVALEHIQVVFKVSTVGKGCMVTGCATTSGGRRREGKTST